MFNSVLQRLRGPSAGTQKAYEHAVRQVADGRELDEGALLDVLAGRTAQDFQNDVQRLHDRRKAVEDLKEFEKLEAQHKAMLEDAKSVRGEIERHPLFLAQAELQRLLELEQKKKLAARSFGADFGGLHGRAMFVLQSTASKSISDGSAELQQQISVLEHDRQRLELRNAEREQYEAALAEVAELPQRIADLKGQPEATVLTARLLVLKQTANDFAERVRQADAKNRAIEKLQKQIDKIAPGFMVPEQMEFISQPKREVL